MRTTLTILRLRRLLCVGACLLWTVPAYAVDTLEVTTPDPAGHVFLKWSGTDLWEETPRHNLRYRWRLDDDDWSRWSNRTDVTLTSLDSGPHTIEVQASDASQNIDLTPAVHAFIVEAPLVAQPRRSRSRIAAHHCRAVPVRPSRRTPSSSPTAAA